jgi:hypothetical protein
MKKILESHTIHYIVAFLVIFAYTFSEEGYHSEWLVGIAIFAIPVTFLVTIIFTFITVFILE